MNAELLSTSQNENVPVERVANLGHVFNADCGRCEWCDAMQNDPESPRSCQRRHCRET